jgi:hypothetical protein
MAVDLTGEVSTPEFFRGLGINDAEALEALSTLMRGETCDLGSLHRLRDLVLRGCFRNEAQLRNALYEVYGADANADYCAAGVEALVALRAYNEVDTREAVAKYCDKWVTDADAVVRLAGEKIPEWLFPALANIARDANGERAFERRITRALMAWGMGGDPLDFTFRQLVEVLSYCWNNLKSYELSESEQWLVFYLAEEEPQY